MTDAKAVGIDLGTTNSAVAWVDESGRTVMIPNTEGDLLTPSVVLFDDAEVVVGKEARSATAVHPEQVAQWVKRDMGSPVFSRPIRGRYLPPEVIQACILRKLNAEIAGVLGPAAKAVITVPAYFDDPRRKATADAGKMAGLTVLDIVNEPTAAALAFGELEGYLAPGGEPLEEMTILVYDLGGGTFDVTLLRLAPGDVRTLATDGDVQLGGYDWDLRLVTHVAEAFQQLHGRDPRDDPAALQRLYNAVLDAKHSLSARNRATVRFEHAGHSAEIPVTREQFEDLTADLLERTAYTTRQLLTTTGRQWADVNRVLLVGGATRMPMVPGMLVQMTGLEPDHTVNPDEAVARGAALYANYLLGQAGESAATTFEVTNVNAHSLGVEGIDQETLLKKNVVLIPHNTPLPATFTEEFITKSEDQRSIVVQVLQGESSLPGECTAIGRTVIRDLPPGLPQGWPVEVTFEYGTNGRLSVRAVVPGTDREVALEIEREAGLSDEGISRWTQAVASSSGFDAFESTVADWLGESEEESEMPAPARPDVEPRAATAASPPAETATPPPKSPPPRAEPPARPPQPPAADAEPPPIDPDEMFQPAGGDSAPAAAEPGPAAADDDPAVPMPDAAQQQAAPSRKRSRQWIVSLIGLIFSSIIGITLGYLLVSWLVPNHGLPRLW